MRWRRTGVKWLLACHPPAQTEDIASGTDDEAHGHDEVAAVGAHCDVTDIWAGRQSRRINAHGEPADCLIYLAWADGQGGDVGLRVAIEHARAAVGDLQ